MEDNWTPTTGKSKPKDFLKKQGFYIVLFICLLIVGTAIVLTALPQQEEAEPAVDDGTGQSSAQEVRQSEDETLAAKNTPLPTATPAATPAGTPTPAPSASPAATASSGAKKGLAPVDGAVVWGFAIDQLLYSRTLDQWTTHAGVDIAAEKGAAVQAVLAGTVEELREDDALGWLVTVAHTNDRVSLYANLDPTLSVQVGQKLNAGDIIGKVGDTATAECGEVSHLHFGFFVGGMPVDPMEHVVIAH